MDISQILKRHRALTWLFGITLVLTVLLFIFVGIQKVSPVSWGWFGDINSSDDLALQGYDPVLYGQGTPKKGSESIVESFGGTKFLFANEDNRAHFKEAPEKYLPEFGGYCAFAVSKGFTAEVDPQVVHVKGDRVLLFHDEGVKKEFLAEEARNLEQASANWASR